MKKKFLVIPVVLLIGGLIWFFAVREKKDGPGQLKVSGNIETTEVALSFKLAGRVLARPASEGEKVEKGQLVARLDESDLEHEVALKEAELASAKAKLDELETGYRMEEVAQARAALEKARVRADNARDEFERQQRLFEEKVIARKAYDTASTSFRVAGEEVKEAEERLAMLEKGYRVEQIADAQANLEKARAGLALARTRLGYAALYSPLNGTVLNENIEPGEYVNPGTPVLTVGALDEVWLRAYINETDLGRIEWGQQAWITTDTYPDRRYEGRITFISSEAEFTPKMVQTDKQRVKLMYRIKITAENPGYELKPGMPVDALIQLEEGDD